MRAVAYINDTESPNTWVRHPGVICGCTVSVHDKKYLTVAPGRLCFDNGLSASILYSIHDAARIPDVHTRYMYLVVLAAEHDLIFRCVDVPEQYMSAVSKTCYLNISYDKADPYHPRTVTFAGSSYAEARRRTAQNDSHVAGGGALNLCNGIVLAKLIVPDTISASDDVRVYNILPECDNTRVLAFRPTPQADGRRSHFYLPEKVFSAKSVCLEVNGVEQEEGEDFVIGVETNTDGTQSATIDFVGELPVKDSIIIATVYTGKVAPDEIR